MTKAQNGKKLEYMPSSKKAPVIAVVRGEVLPYGRTVFVK